MLFTWVKAKGVGRRKRVGQRDDGDSASKGAKGWLRCSCHNIAISRQGLVGVCFGLCLLAGGARFIRLSREDESPTKTQRRKTGSNHPILRGVGNRWGARKGELLLSNETSYCSAPLAYPLVVPPKAIAGDSQARSLVLRQLQVTIRHGDRSAIHQLPGASEQRWRCSPYSDYVQQIWERVDRFSVFNVDGRRLQRSLWPELLENDDVGKLYKGQTGLCKPGQLTEIGVRQHLTLGTYMKKAYSEFLSEDLLPEQIYVRSTDYTRTLQSAAAFLMSFFRGSSEISIITDEDQSGEVMHGVGLKGIDKNVKPGETEKMTTGACDRAAQLSKTQNGGFIPRADVVKDLAGIFSAGISDLRMTETADTFHAMSCHNMTLPCTSKGCVSPNLAFSVMSQADSQMCMRYQGAAGGLEAASLSLYPFTSELLENMKAVLAGDMRTKFALFSGHDTVVAPLLAALGAFNCKWPPYASHVAFELWSKPAGTVHANDANGRRRGKRRRVSAELKDEHMDGREIEDVSGGSSAEISEDEGKDVVPGEAKREDVDHALEKDIAYVRLTFNGQPVTHRITDCRGLSEADRPYGPEFCPLSAFANTVRRALGVHKTLAEACSAFQAKNDHG